MNIDCMKNLRVLVAINQNSVSEQNLKLLGVKYNLSDAELQELSQYCKDNGIDVYDEEKKVCVSDNSNACSIRKTDSMTEEEKENGKQVSIIAKRIMHVAVVRARKRVNGLGWLCGTYTSSVKRLVEKQIRKCFSNEELNYIVERLTDSDEDIIITKDQQSPEKSEELNDKLNDLIPRLHINRFYTDLFAD